VVEEAKEKTEKPEKPKEITKKAAESKL